MTREKVLTYLMNNRGYISGQKISEELNISRAAVWKVIRQLKDEGYVIESATNKGYCLISVPDMLSKDEIEKYLGSDMGDSTIIILDEVDSTNTYCKRLAGEGAKAGTVVIAEKQTGGKGRRGKSFSSPKGLGLYLSVILRPDRQPGETLHLTSVFIEAACDAVENACGIRPQIKWTNDLVIGKKKISGTLTEMSIEAESGHIDYVVLGTGINCNQALSDFPDEIQDMASSLGMETGENVSRNRLAAELIKQFKIASDTLFTEKKSWMERYKKDCITLGKDVKIITGDKTEYAHVDDIDEDGCLLVTYLDGQKGKVFSGEVSVRGMYGYV